MLNKTEMAFLVSGIATIAGVVFGIKKKLPWWFYLVLFLVIVPAATRMGWAVGANEDNPEIDKGIEEF